MITERNEPIGEGQWDGTGSSVGGPVDLADVELAEELREVVRILQAQQATYVVSRLGSLPSLASPIGGAHQPWTTAFVSALCAAIASVLEGLVWDASTRVDSAHVRIESLRDNPYVELLPLPNSRMARRHPRDEAIRLSGKEIASLLSPILQLEPEQSLEAWSTIVPILIEAEECLPNVLLSRDPATSALLVELKALENKGR
jgi:hypothetical protein